MVVELEVGAQRVVVNAKPTSLSVMVDAADVFTFDPAGRLWSALMGGCFFRRGLDNRVFEKRRVAPKRLGYAHRGLSAAEGRGVVECVRDRIQSIHAAVARGEASVRAPRGQAEQALCEAAEVLKRILGHDYETLAADGQRFQALYQLIGILPPDQYLALVLQATEGCHYNRCTFCTFYHGRRFRVKTPGEFHRHVRAVREYFGEALAMRRSVFLGDANALIIPQPRLLELLRIVHEELLVAPAAATPATAAGNGAWPPQARHVDGIYSFLDLFSGRKKTWQDFAALCVGGLRRVYIGLETGDDELLRFLNKPATSAEAREVVLSLKRAGLHVGMIVLLGAGGERFAARHVERTVETLNALPLDADDLLYFSPLVEQAGWDYGRLTAAADIRPLTEDQIWAQMEAMVAGLRCAAAAHPPTIAPYDIREFVY